MVQLRASSATEQAGLESDDGQVALAVAYGFVQILIGVFAFTLPFVLVIGNWALGGHVQDSISAYYYTKMHAWFIGTQFVLGVFFLSYHYRALEGFVLDNRMADVAGAAMLVVALIPTKDPATDQSNFGNYVHIAAALLVFVLLGWFAYWRFTKSGRSGVTARKVQRNRLYHTCGVIIGGCIAILIVEVLLFPDSWKQGWHPTLVFESIAIFAFGVSWLVKGGFLGILADPTVPTPPS